jgi:ACS family hexuronate transporter-like MFS transporter
LRPDPKRWLMIALVFLATAINYLDRQALSVTAPILRDAFGMSNSAYSRVIFAFMLAYTVMNGLSGVLIDRLGTRLGYALCMLWWSAATLLHALARGAWSLGVFRFLLGMGEAGNWPAGVRVVAEWFPEQERALASGLFNSGSAVGAILAPPLIAGIVLWAGWPAAFLAVGLSGLVWLVLWWTIYHVPLAPAASGGGVSTPEKPYGPGVLLRTRFVRVFTISKVFLDPAWYFYIFWFPEYLRRARGFDLAAIGKYAWIPFAVAGFGNLLGGWLAAALLARKLGLSAVRKTCVMIFAALMAAAIPAVFVRDVRVAIALVSLAMMGYTACSANMLAIPADAFPKSAVGSIYGLASMGSGFGGMVFSLLTGWAVDRFSYVPVFVAFGIMPSICAVILWRALGPIHPAAVQAQLRKA